MATLSARERVLEMGSGRAAGGATGGFEKARQLATMHNQPMLALKAFCAWLHHASTTDSARAFGLLDLSLYCNKFATEQATAADVEIHLRLVRARDYFQLVVDEFEELYQVHLPLSSVEAAAALVDAGAPFALPKSVPVGLVTVLMITLHNWACVEMAVAGDGIQMASKLFAVCHQIEEQLQSSSGLGSSWEAVQNVTSATRAVVKCNFPLAESAARRAVEIVGVSASQAQDNGAAASSVNGDTAFLQAVALYSLGVATEVSACEDALRSYEEALKRLLQSRSGSLHQAVMEQTRGHLQQYIDAEQSRERMRLAAEEALASAHSDRRGQNASRPRRPQGTARRTARKVSNSRTSISGQSLFPVVAPPVPEPLQQYLAEHGLSTFVCLACSFKGVFDTLGHSLPRSKGDAPLPLSLFAGTRYEASDAESIFAVPLCSTTPLQWTLLLREAANQPSVATRRSVWSPRPTLAPLLSELAAQRPPGPKSASASQTRKEITEGNNKLRQQVLQLFSPPTATSKIKKNAHDSVDAVVQLLGQRLSVLLKTERAFEDHWTATERVASALRSYAVSRDLVLLKKTLLSQQRLRQMRRERSARVIANFFRDVVSQRGRRIEKSASHQQQMAEKERSAIVFQKYTRRWLAVQELRKRAEAQAAYVQKVVLVQSLARRMFARAAYDDLRRVRASQKHLYSEQARQAYAALQIQRVYRGHCARLRCYHLLGMSHEAVLHHLRDSRTYYATLIQKHIRGALVRLQYGKAVYAQRCYGRNVYRRRLWERSCVTIQRAFRAHRLRRANALSSANEATLRVTGSAASRRLLAAAGEGTPFGAAATEIAAAQRIQSAYRCGVAKRRLEALRYARVRDDSSTAISHYSAAPPFVLKDSFF